MNSVHIERWGYGTHGEGGDAMVSDGRGYHHGDLRQTVLAAGMAEARTGGPRAVVMRDLARTAGVSPNAVYRHFADRDDLMRALAARAQDALASRIGEEIARADPEQDRASAAIDRLRRIGLGYIAFARAEPGWFELAFTTSDREPSAGIVTLDDETVAPFQVLLDALDAMVETGALDADRRPHAEWPCWSAVHGFADIVAHGPLRVQPDAVVDALASVVVDAAITGVRGTDVRPPA